MRENDEKTKQKTKTPNHNKAKQKNKTKQNKNKQTNKKIIKTKTNKQNRTKILRGILYNYRTVTTCIPYENAVLQLDLSIAQGFATFFFLSQSVNQVFEFHAYFLDSILHNTIEKYRRKK